MFNPRVVWCLFVTATIACTAFSSEAVGQEKLSNFMKVKLDHSQKTLEGLSKGDFELIG